MTMFAGARAPLTDAGALAIRCTSVESSRLKPWQIGRSVADPGQTRTGLEVPTEGMIVMRLPSRLLRVALLLPVPLLLGTAAGAAAQDSHAHEQAQASADTPSAAIRTGRWSDSATWPDGKVPREGDAVTIARDMHVVLDVDPPALRSLTIDGKLSFADDRDIGLETEWLSLIHI